jgi:Holliday junction resolvase
VTSSSKLKGDRAEREVERLLRDELGVPARRALGAGRKDDMGDITGVPGTVISVAAWADLDRAVNKKLPELAQQQIRAGADYAAMFCRRRGGSYVVVMTPEMWCAMVRETL